MATSIAAIKGADSKDAFAHAASGEKCSDDSACSEETPIYSIFFDDLAARVPQCLHL